MIRLGKGLHAGGLSHGEVPQRAVRTAEHILTTGNTIYACLERLSWWVELGARLPGIRARSRLADVIQPAFGLFVGCGSGRSASASRTVRQEASGGP